MSDTSIFEISDIDVDMSNYVKLRCKCALNDTLIFKLFVYNQLSPVNLDDFNVEFRARLNNGQIYSEVDNITKSGNLLTVTCDSILASQIGEQNITIRLWDNTYKQKSNYLIVLKVMSTIDEDEKVAESSVLSAMNSLDISINRYIELKTNLFDGIAQAETELVSLQTIITTGNTLKSDLTVQNNQATSNINDLTVQNNQANNNIPNLTLQNNQASNNIYTLTTQNSNAVTNNNNLTNNIAIGTLLSSNLKTQITQGTGLLSDLTDANSIVNRRIDDIVNIIDTLMVGSTFVTENGDVLINESGDILTV